MKTLKPVERKDLIPGRIYYTSDSPLKSKMLFVKRDDENLYFKSITNVFNYIEYNEYVQFGLYGGCPFYTYPESIIKRFFRFIKSLFNKRIF
jgi:hypothetical protein